MKLLSLICLAFLISGCAAYTGAPKPAIDVDKTIDRYTRSLEAIADTPPSNCHAVKDNANKFLTIIDLRYAEFIDGLSTETKTKATATDFALIGLGLAGTAVGGAEAKTILHAISTGVAAANTSIDKNFFYEKTIPSLVSQMDADRKEKLSEIIQRYTYCTDEKGYPSYSWFEAVHDMADYYKVGTLLGAINSINANAGAKQAKAEEEIKSALGLTRSANTDDKTALRIALRGGKADAILACWKTVNPGLFEENKSTGRKSVCATGVLSAARLINAAECAADQTAVRKCLGE